MLPGRRRNLYTYTGANIFCHYKIFLTIFKTFFRRPRRRPRGSRAPPSAAKRGAARGSAGRQPGRRAAPAVADSEDGGLQGVDGGLQVTGHLVPRRGLGPGRAPGGAVPGIVRLETRLEAVEKCGGDGFVAIAREAVGELADVVRDPEDLLDQDKAAAPGVPNARWIAIRLLDGDAAVEEALTSGRLVDLVARQQGPDQRFSRKIALQGAQ